MLGGTVREVGGDTKEDLELLFIPHKSSGFKHGQKSMFPVGCLNSRFIEKDVKRSYYLYLEIG